jgi:hypothetical protein
MLIKILIFNVIFHAIMIVVYAFFLRSTIERHTDIGEIPFKPLLRCSLLAFFPSFILSAVLVGTGLWQVIQTDPSQPISRHWLVDVGYLLFFYGSVYAITTWDLHRRFMFAIDALDVSFNKLMIFTAAKTSLSAPVVLLVSVLMLVPLIG